MKKIALITLLVTGILTASSQPKQFLDSLKQAFTEAENDSLKFRILDELAWTYKRINADSALMYGQQGLKISEGLSEQLKGIILATIGVTKSENGIGDFGVTELEEALLISQRLGIERRVASNYTNIGNAYEGLGRYDSAIHYTLQAIQLKLDLGDSMSAASTMANLALIYKGLDNDEKALFYLNDALKIVGPNHRRAGQIYNNLGVIYQKQEKHLEARNAFLKSIRGMNMNDRKGIFSSVYGNIGISYLGEQRYDSAIYYTKEALRLKQEIGQRSQIVYPAKTLARIYSQLNENEEARYYAELAVEVAFENESLDFQLEATVFLAQLELKEKKFEAAANQMMLAFDLSDSINSINVLNAVEEAEAKFQNRLKEQENEFLRQEASIREAVISNQNTTLILIFLIVLLLIVMAFLMRKQLKERKQLIDKVAEQSAKLKELDQAKSRFFSNISHDLRSPLTLILGALDKITERDYEVMDKESKNMLDVGYKNGKRLLYLADEIMDLTRLEEGKINLDLQYVKIVPYLRLLTKMFSSAADIKLIELKFTSEADDETILQLDPHQFEKIVYNLLSNAIKFTPNGGKVDVSLKAGKKDIEMQISDTGNGIPEESIKYVFDRYYQAGAKEFKSQAGVGIGLALVKELVELHQGSIKVQSSESGTLFKVAIPFKESNWVSKAVIPERSLDVVTRNSLWIDLQEEKEQLQVPSLDNIDENAKRILIVEDHKELRSYLKSILSTDYRVYLAANGADALDILQSEKIDLIVTDLMMPYMDGFEFIDHLKKDKELKKLPVLVVSARTDKTEKLTLIAKGAEEVISKPFDKEELFLRIKNLLSREWDNNKQLSTLYGETAEEFEKNIMARLERLILKRVDDPHLSVLDLADEMAASERKVYRMIKKISGLTPYELIKEIRWQYLDNYIKNNSIRTATEAAQLIGMNNVSSFSEQYTKRFGHSIKEELHN